MSAAEVLDTIDWKRIHGELTKLSRAKGEYDAEEARWILAGFRARVHAQLGYASFLEYLERTFGYAPRVAHDRLRVAQALDGLPELRAGLAEGQLNWSVVREVTRVAVPETEADWIEAADGQTVRDVERMVRGRVPGDRPDDPQREEAVTRRLALDVSPETLATFREAVGRLRQETETPISDEEALLEMSRRVLGGPAGQDVGEASYQIALTVCPSCGAGSQRGRGESVPVDAAVIEQAQCDARTFDASTPSVDCDESAHVGGGAPWDELMRAALAAVRERDLVGCGHPTDSREPGRESPRREAG